MTTSLRRARASDYAHFEQWFPMLGSGDRVPSQARWHDRLSSRTIIAEREGAPVGYCYAETFAEDGYVRHLVVDPRARGRGVGRALLEAAQQSMREAGCLRWRLNVKPDNVPAVSLYRAMGMSVSHECASLRFGWSLLETFPPPSGSLTVVEPDVDEVTRLERRFDLPKGQLVAAAAQPTMHLRAAVADRPVGMASFDTSIPGAFPFRAESIDAASTLLHGLRSLASEPQMGVVVEGFEALEVALRDAGARVAFRFAQMRGPLC